MKLNRMVVDCRDFRRLCNSFASLVLIIISINIHGMDFNVVLGDSQELILDVIVETCSDLSGADKSFVDTVNILKNTGSGKEIFSNLCWEGVTVEYEVTNVGCVDSLTKQNQDEVRTIFENGYSDAIVLLLSSCKSLTSLQKMVLEKWPTRASRVIIITPQDCDSEELTVRPTDSILHMFINDNLTFQRVLSETLIKSVLETNEQFITIFYDDTKGMVRSDAIKLSKTLFKMGVEVQLLHYNEYLTVAGNYFEKWLNRTAIVLITCSQINTLKLLKKAADKDRFHGPKISWIVFDPDDVNQVQSAVSRVFRYDSRLLIVKRTKSENPMNVTMLILQVLQKKFGTYGYKNNDCLPCNLDSHNKGKTLRVVYNSERPYNSRVECVALWDLSMALSSTLQENGVWGHKFPRMFGIKLKVAAVDDPPFVTINRLKNGTLTGEGFLIDVWETLADSLKFRYEIIEPADKSYGLLLPNGSFSGIIGLVQRRKADLGLGAFSFLEERTKAVDYLRSYISYKGVKLVYKDPEIDSKFSSDWITQFTQPFQATVWMFIVMVVVASSISVTLCESLQRLPPHFMSNNPRIDEFKNPFNNLFYMYSALLNQGWDMTPDLTSSRTIVICFRFFCIFMYAGYSAVIVSQNVVTRNVEPFNSLEDIIYQGTYKLGTLKNTNYERILERANSGLYKRTWDYISKHPDNMVRTSSEGFAKAEREKYVFMNEEDIVEHKLNKECMFKAPADAPLQGVNTFVVQKDSPYAETLSQYLTLMHETGVIQRLRGQRWKPKKIDACDYLLKKRGGATTQEGVTLTTLVMPFVLMLSGIAATIVFLAAEFQAVHLCSGFCRLSS
ncbi:Uncharacterised protein g7934 [Pycnogonum litorale]